MQTKQKNKNKPKHIFSMIRDIYFIFTLRGGVIHTILLIQAITISFNTLKALNNIMFALNDT